MTKGGGICIKSNVTSICFEYKDIEKCFFVAFLFRRNNKLYYRTIQFCIVVRNVSFCDHIKAKVDINCALKDYVNRSLYDQSTFMIMCKQVINVRFKSYHLFTVMSIFV